MPGFVTRFSSSARLLSAILAAMLCCVMAPNGLLAQTASTTASPSTVAPRGLITQAVDETQLTTLKGNMHPLARPEFDLGTAPATLPMARMLLVLKRSAAQEAALRTLLDNQQDKHSPSYHKWLSPEQYGAQFGPTDSDMATIKAWLQSHGFQVESTKGRTVLEFSGSASQVQEAFHTTIHKYMVNGEQHWANASDPQIPTALTAAVAGIASLNNFPRKAMNTPAGIFTRDNKSGKIISQNPLLTYPGNYCTPVGECYGLGPYDFATIYNVAPLWNAGIDGTGVTIAIVGETDIQLSDVQAFRSLFGLPANDPNFIWNGPDPGILGDESEADIDVQWSGGVAKGATIDFVISESTETTAGTDLSAVYIVDQNLAPIMSESYGQCELALGTTGNQFYSSLWQQASAQGITVFISAGDAGSAGCDNFDAEGPAPAEFGLQVSGYASTPYNVAVGGTDFNDFDNSTTYWSTTNNSSTQQSALSYIPETTWNDSCTNALWGTISGFSTNPETNCNNSNLAGNVVPEGGSGGVSACTAPSGSTPQNCAGGYTKPAWQSGTGVPADGKRDLPDVSLFASNGFIGESYLICQADQGGDCPSQYLGFGGTSVSSPAFAGIMALVNQKTGERQGNANYVFYKLASRSGASCISAQNESSSCIFNDITQGTIAMPCAAGSPNCTTSSGDSYGILNGYTAAAGYDLATGLGSVNANNLVNQWSSVASLASTTTLTSLTPTTITHGQSVNFTVSVKPESGAGTAPTGTISLIGPTTGNNTSQGIAGFNLSNGTFTGTTDLLPGGTYSVTAHYPGDSNYAPSDSSGISVTVGKENSQPQAFLVTFNANNNVISSDTNTAIYGSPYILRVNVENSAGQMCAPTAASGATGCPSGNVTMTDNGTALDAGTYTLNSYGYFEDYTVQLPGGTNSVKAAYAGDGGFNASSETSTITITPAVTTFLMTVTPAIEVGQLVQATGAISTQSSGAGPTGTVTFLLDGNVVPGTPYVTPYAGTATTFADTEVVSQQFTLTSGGSHTFSAQYSGDANYIAANTATAKILGDYAPPTASVNVSNQTVAAGASVTVTALFDTSVKGPVLTGGVSFTDSSTGVAIPGTVILSPGTDTNGNPDLQASITYAPPANQSVRAAYAGDPNYGQASGYTSVTVTGTDFFLGVASSFTVPSGQAATVYVFVEGQTGYNGTISFTQASLAGLPPETTATFNNPTITGAGTALLYIGTTARSAATKKAVASARFWRTVSGSLFLASILLLVFPVFGRHRRNLFAIPMLALVLLASACGGGGGNGGGSGGGNPGTLPGTYPITITAISGAGSNAITHTATFNLIVQ
jgi:hypothetical protein